MMYVWMALFAAGIGLGGLPFWGGLPIDSG